MPAAKDAVEKRLAYNRHLEQAAQYATGLTKGNNIASWHEKDTKRLKELEARLTASLNAAGGWNSNQVTVIPGGEEYTRGVGVKTAVETVRLARRARLKELYEREAASYEAELQALGLGLVKPTV